MANYKTGNGPQQISLMADIATIGLAGTRASINKAGNPPISVANSADVTGDIMPAKDIGSASSIQGSVLTISTIIDLRLIPDRKARETESKSIKSAYILDNGTDGHVVDKNPDNKIVDDDFNSVILIKLFNLV
ncbi:MAG: hypothetical protein ABI855_11370 [Bacteroidota bacterium]